MKTYLWKINKGKLNKTNLALYSNFIKKKYKVNSGNDFNKIWKWSVDNPKIFWKSIWDFTKVKGDLGDTLLKESNIFYKNRFFPNARLNYAKNLLKKNNEKKSIIFKSENGYKTTLSWKNLNLNVNEKKMQAGNTKNMIFNTNFLLSYLSKFMSLQPGDIVTTGTPAGVGMGMKPPVFLKAGDKIKLSIDNLGEQNSKVITE